MTYSEIFAPLPEPVTQTPMIFSQATLDPALSRRSWLSSRRPDARAGWLITAARLVVGAGAGVGARPSSAAQRVCLSHLAAERAVAGRETKRGRAL